jgi:EmrB/QacA subfamily drug resistance transporter
MFLSTLDTGIINVALPTLGRQFGVGPAGIAWAVTLYLVALGATIVLFGRLADRHGRVKLYATGLVVFGVGSVLCGFASSAPMLVASRALQGVGAAMLQAIAAALVTTLVSPKRRGAALGTLGVMIGLGPVLGPTVGGFLISTVGWRWIFWINIPFCLAGLLGCLKLRGADAPRAVQSASLDLPGNALIASGVLALLFGASVWPDRGITNPLVLGAFGAFAVFAVAFLLHERRADEPLLEPSLLRSPSFGAPLAATGAFGAASAVAFVVPPYFLERTAGLVPWQVGLVSFCAPLGLVALSQVSGSNMDRIGPRRLMVTGLAVMLAALAVLFGIHAGWPPVLLAALLFAYGVGGGIFQPANIAAVMGAAQEGSQGTVGAVQRMVQNLFIAVGAAVGAAFIGADQGTGGAWSFRGPWVFAAVLVAAVLLAFLASARPRPGDKGGHRSGQG